MTDPRLRVAMFVGTAERCGVGEYSRALVEAMAPWAAVTPVAGTFAPRSRAEHRKLGSALNVGRIAHVQHAYAFWGGMAPHRSRFSAFLGAVRVPVVMTVHELDSAPTGRWGLPAPLERAYKRLFNRITFGSPRVRALVVHAPSLRRGLLELGIPPSRVRLMPMPAPAVSRLDDGCAFRARHGLEERFVVTLFGFLARRKGYELALDALAQLPPSVTLLVAGDAHPADRSDARGWLRAEIAARRLEDRVRCLGFVPEAELPAVMGASDLVLAPFTRMSASASIQLALAHGRPVLASDLEANRALPCLACFPAGDAAALAAAIEVLRGDPDRRAALGASALAFARENSTERLARETVALYEEILADADRD